jgi:hypothetical protein
MDRAAVLTTLPEGTPVELTEPPEGEWQPVFCAGQPGYVATQFVAADGDARPAPALQDSQAPEPSAVPTATSTRVPMPTATPAPSPTEEQLQTSSESRFLLAAGPLIFAPVADAHVEQAFLTTHFGTASTLLIDNNPNMETYLRFDVSGRTEPIQSAHFASGLSIPRQTAPGLRLLGYNLGGKRHHVEHQADGRQPDR